MGTIHNGRLLGAIVCASALLAPLAASSQDAGEKAVKARQGFMQVVGWNAGPLFGMAKGEVAYDAEQAATAAANLKALAGMSIGNMFPEGTSKADMPGKTRALPDIWADMAKFGQAHDAWATAVDGVNDAAGKGQEALAAAVGELGKSCGGCHKPFRADEF